MYGEEHYLSKIERNMQVLDKAPEELRAQISQNIIWCREITKRLEQLDYDVREATITKMHKILDDDYLKMGFGTKEETNSFGGRKQ